MPYHQNMNPADVVNALNAMIAEAKGGKKIFCDFYTTAQKKADPAKEHTGLFFARDFTATARKPTATLTNCIFIKKFFSKKRQKTLYLDLAPSPINPT
jgi:hypothetical protein